jgi:hypothetical protein
MTETQKEAESCAAQNAATRSENTHKLSDFRAKSQSLFPTSETLVTQMLAWLAGSER